MITKAYSELSPTSKMESFAKKVDDISCELFSQKVLS